MAYPRRSTAKNPSSVASIGAASATLVAANRDRLELFLKNTHATQSVSLNLGTEAAVAGEGIVLAAGEGIAITSYSGAITAIGSGAATTVAIAEV